MVPPRGFILIVLVAIACIRSSASLEFKWKAFLNRSTGIATSLETSKVPSSCRLYRAILDSKTPAKHMQQVFGSYPSWLAGWRVTFGCLKACPVMDTKRNKQAILICDSLFGTTLLSFGPEKSRVMHRKRLTTYSTVIPIVGGVLALPSSEGTYGSLSFQLKKTASNNDSVLTLETSIVDDYRPAIAGMAPSSRFRAGLYRSTQSLFHAYIMWRFHHYCYHQSDC